MGDTITGYWEIVDANTDLPYALSMHPILLLISVSNAPDNSISNILPPTSSLDLGIDAHSHLSYLWEF
jgi:hypothetical protein